MKPLDVSHDLLSILSLFYLHEEGDDADEE
jgi:hypothetical protein